MPDLIHSFEDVVDELADEIVKRSRELNDAIGARPFGTEKLGERDQVTRYATMHTDPVAWQGLINEHGWKPTLRYAERMQKMMARYPDVVQSIPHPPPPPEPQPIEATPPMQSSPPPGA